MLCVKCKKEIADGSAFCNWCGKKQQITKTKKRSARRVNGQGSICKLTDRKRKKPYMARLKATYDPFEGREVRPILGYFETKEEAANALAQACENMPSAKYNYSVDNLYKEWSDRHFKDLTKSGIDSIKASWKYLDPIKEEKFRLLRTEDIQKCIDAAVNKGKSRATCEKIKQLYSQLCKYAMQYDIINKNYAEFIKLPKTEKTEKKIFTDEQIELLFKNSQNDIAKIILILIYTGFRINELFNITKNNVNLSDLYLIGGSKTESGKNRLMPINEKITDFILYFYNKSDSHYLIPNEDGGKKDAGNFRKREFYPFLSSLNITGITPHCTRHTFATLGQAAGIAPEDMIKLIGHADYSTTTENYVHQNIDKLRNAINKI